MAGGVPRHGCASEILRRCVNRGDRTVAMGCRLPRPRDDRRMVSPPYRRPPMPCVPPTGSHHAGGGGMLGGKARRRVSIADAPRRVITPAPPPPQHTLADKHSLARYLPSGARSGGAYDVTPSAARSAAPRADMLTRRATRTPVRLPNTCSRKGLAERLFGCAGEELGRRCRAWAIPIQYLIQSPRFSPRFSTEKLWRFSP